METPLELAFKKKVAPVVRYAATLKTLTVEPEGYDDEHYQHSFHNPKYEKCDLEGCEFPQLQVLTIRGYEMEFFKRCLFPAVTRLRLKNVQYDDINFKLMKEWMCKFPALTDLCIESCMSVVWDFYSDDPLKVDPLQPKIETLTIPYYDHNLFRAQKNSLSTLNMKFADLTQMSLILRLMKNLKTLSISQIRPISDETPNFIQNTSIEHFRLGHIRRTIDNLEDIDAAVILQHLQQILPALPSLKEFILIFGVSSGLVQFVANNLVNLKKLYYSNLYGRQLEEGTMKTYQEIRNNHHRYLNGNFELLLFDPQSHYAFRRH